MLRVRYEVILALYVVALPVFCVILLPENVEEHSFGCGNPLAFSNVREGDTVLDLGCGAGLDLLI